MIKNFTIHPPPTPPPPLFWCCLEINGVLTEEFSINVSQPGDVSECANELRWANISNHSFVGAGWSLVFEKIPFVYTSINIHILKKVVEKTEREREAGRQSQKGNMIVSLAHTPLQGWTISKMRI